MAATAAVALVGGCARTAAEPVAQTVTQTVSVTETVTATVTETAVATGTPAAMADPVPAPEPAPLVPTPAPAPPPPSFELTVLEDGCAVERTEGEVHNLTWSVTDDLDVQVLGRNALGETRYRYFRPGTWTVVLTAWGGDRYVPVSNEVEITC